MAQKCRKNAAKKIARPPPRKYLFPNYGASATALHYRIIHYHIFQSTAPKSRPSKSRPTKEPFHQRAAPKSRPAYQSHFLNLKNQKVKHEMKIISKSAKMYPTGMMCPFTSHTHSNSGMALKFMP